MALNFKTHRLLSDEEGCSVCIGESFPPSPPRSRPSSGLAAMVDADGLAYKDVLRELRVKGEATRIHQ